LLVIRRVAGGVPPVRYTPLQRKPKEEDAVESLKDTEGTRRAEGKEDSRSLNHDRLRQEMLRNMAGLRAQLARVTGNPDLASDLLHDAIVTALQKLQTGELSDSAHLAGYVYRVALNHYRNYRRKDRTNVSDSAGVEGLVSADSKTRPVDAIEATQWSRMVKELLKEITPVRDRELLVRFYLYEQSKDELCRLFDLSELHFNRVIYRARDRFRELLRRRGFVKSDFLSIAAILMTVF
jgi:RNA polymerase sigma-70 factor (ECF subfamily)